MYYLCLYFYSYVGNYIFNGWYFSCVISVSLFFMLYFVAGGVYIIVWQFQFAFVICESCFFFLCILAYYDFVNVHGHCALTRFFIV